MSIAVTAPVVDEPILIQTSDGFERFAVEIDTD